MADDNYSTRSSAGTLAGTEVLPVWKAGDSVKTTVADVGTYVAGANLPLVGSLAATYSTLTPVSVTVTGTMPANCSYLQLTHASTPIAITGLTPAVGQTLVITHNSTGTANHTVKTAGTYDGTNNTATLNAQYKTLVLFGLSATRWAVVQNIGTVAFSAT
jgi:hypothetical protein